MKCEICWDKDSSFDNPLVICDGRGRYSGGCIAAHKECYGIANIPEGPWFCEKCQSGGPNTCCAICGRKDGALKKTLDGNWAHTECVWWTKEFAGVFSVKQLREACPERSTVNCDVCKGKGGAQECLFGDCMKAAHPYCARNLMPARRRWMLRTRRPEGYDQLCYEVFCDEHREVARGKGEIEVYTNFMDGDSKKKEEVTLTQAMLDDDDEDEGQGRKRLKKARDKQREEQVRRRNGEREERGANGPRSEASMCCEYTRDMAPTKVMNSSPFATCFARRRVYGRHF